MKNYIPNQAHANYAEEVDVVTKWLKAFKDGQLPKDQGLGLCNTSIIECYSLMVIEHSGRIYGNFPINDTESVLSPREQYRYLHHYRGRQLELRVEYAEHLIDYFNESIRI